ncbi:CaiB/BaiF CoA transferase family protein [Variovorax terrae]|uniref:CoA transferase n=1 Tax=Variovorax terrae TaxID=2923278 RepID=A0A9X1VU22_9BURK|nr:CoA transferase [Variovorax terrae]MCJ0763856.1 CoA transferase [Variovorax terrae]
MLSGIRVISFNHFHAGPVAAQFLADLGADVIAVEPVDGAFHRNWAVANRFVAGQSVNLLTSGRNKRSLALDMKSAEGKAIARRLLEGADVVMENFRPGAMDRMGFGYEQVKAFNPGVVYASVSGYGASGPDRDMPGQDLLLQARSGLAARTGRADGAPTPTGPVIVDQHAASLLAMGILAALLGRVKSGKGCLVEGSLLQSAIDLQSESLTAWLNGAPSDTPRGRHGLASWCSAGPSGIHATADGWLAISMASPADLAAALDLPALATLPASASFSQRDEITRLVAERLAHKTTAEWLPALQQQAIWHMPVKDYDDLRGDAQLAHLGAFVDTPGAEGEQVTLLAHPLRYDGAAPPLRLVPQKLGAQTRDILSEAGYDAQQIEAFVQSRVVAAATA